MRVLTLQTTVESEVDAFERLYQENLGLVYHYIYSHIGNRHEAEDLTADVFLKAARTFDLSRAAHSGRTWLLLIARTTLADYWRVYYRSSPVSLESLLEVGWDTPLEEDLSPANNGAEEQIQRILQDLPAQYREVLTCRFLLSLTIRETALRMGLTETNVKVIQFRALKRAATLQNGKFSLRVNSARPTDRESPPGHQ
jgi:RNA polymerase sigma-70 factor (ECF subfamily)